MSLVQEGLHAFHAALAPTVVKRLAQQFEGEGPMFIRGLDVNNALYAQSAEEAAYYVRRAGLSRQDMKQIVFTHVQREDLIRFQHIVTSSRDKSSEGATKTAQKIDEYIAFRRSHKSLFTPNAIERVIDKVSALFPSTRLT